MTDKKKRIRIGFGISIKPIKEKPLIGDCSFKNYKIMNVLSKKNKIKK